MHKDRVSQAIDDELATASARASSVLQPEIIEELQARIIQGSRRRTEAWCRRAGIRTSREGRDLNPDAVRYEAIGMASAHIGRIVAGRIAKRDGIDPEQARIMEDLGTSVAGHWRHEQRLSVEEALAPADV